ncbi:DNA polymerase III subunit alpha (PolC) [Spiroplasma sabaudiense Ar-1343]|uniref:DNA polymerase III PolC-type n=1 Tax=Spiroplasma sabaudiense Ar-1343 TaxID=1276257 RepID=W6AAV0_9MOLU|nr:PolC-type DNA polymerase III [Spiroplasma sabaudiense]AHI53980.1 DNA polymerase III subunit alpha (PolC) [Spiroplasma sabaudiense Ar-1343]
MDQKLQEFFSRINIYLNDSQAQLFSKACLLENPEFDIKKNRANIIIKIVDFLPTNFLIDWEPQLLKNSVIPTKIKFFVENQEYSSDLVWEYFQYIINHKANFKAGFVKTLSLDCFCLEGQTLIITAADETEKQLWTKHKDFYLKKFCDYGFKNLKIIFKINPNAVDLIAQVDDAYKKVNEIVAQKKDTGQTTSFNSVVKKPFGDKKSFFKKSTINFEEPTYNRLEEIEDSAQNVIIHGRIIKKAIKFSPKSGRNIYTLALTDDSSSLMANYFQRVANVATPFDEVDGDQGATEELITVGDWVALQGSLRWNDYSKDNVFYIDNFQKLERSENIRQDHADEKRVELHVHSKMSVMDGVSSITDFINYAAQWGHKAIALTDHLNVQAYPEAAMALAKINKNRQDAEKLKMIYGVEMTMLSDDLWYVKNPKNQNLNQAKFVFFDLETTGLSPEFDEIIEFGAVTYNPATGESKKIDILIKPERQLSRFTTELTGITDDMLADKPDIKTAFKEIMEIIKDTILVAHNANFDLNFLKSWSSKLGFGEINNTVIDTLSIARVVLPKIKNHRLGTVAKNFGVLYDEKIAHRGDYDAEILRAIYERILMEAKKTFTIATDSDWNSIHPEDNKNNTNYLRSRGHHTNVLAKNQDGLKDLYKLISWSHTFNFFGSPKIFQSKLLEFRQKNNILIGSGCVNGQIFDLARTGRIVDLEAAILNYDFVEIQPLSVYKNLIQTSDLTNEELERIIKLIITATKKCQKIIVATSDAHYVDPKLKSIREVFINSKGLGGSSHPLYDFKQRISDYPDQHLRTTQEMLDEFKFLNDDNLAYEIVVRNSNLIANEIDGSVSPLKTGSYPPQIENVDKMLTDLCYQNAKKLYGENLPLIVAQRLEKELSSIIKHGFAVVYWISHKLVTQSLADGYLVGSRGSVGSSFVATTSLITEVNPLKAHYRCEKCQFSDFNTPPEIKCGYDLPKQHCPNCKALLIGDGHDIPFETFLGFDGDKVPDIDLNFSGDYQARAHNFTKEMFGENNVFRAGTISTVADKTAYGYVKAYFEKIYGVDYNPRRVEVERLADLATGVKRTTGQHPGGIVILPAEFEIEDFTPVNYPADDTNSSWLTTHFDFHSIHDNLLKMDILGHVDPTALKMLKDFTGFDPLEIPTNDPEVYKLFSGLESLKIKAEDINGETTGAIGIPEFGTQFVRSMLRETQPKTFADLVQISGLSHGTDVWINNAQGLIKAGEATISSVIGCRDDIMVYLMDKGLDPSMAFAIMESVRKGNGIPKEEWVQEMLNNNVPQWYIDSCLKIKYMFPKAHATAYVLMAYRVAWYKIYYPEEYYATYFSTRADFFDLEAALGGASLVQEKLRDLEVRSNRNENLSTKERALITVYEILLEMFARGIKIQNINFKDSDALNFKIVVDPETHEKVIVPPFNVIDSLGEAVAHSIVNARSEKQFTSINDLRDRTQITKNQIKMFEELQITSSLENDEQMKFDF